MREDTPGSALISETRKDFNLTLNLTLIGNCDTHGLSLMD